MAATLESHNLIWIRLIILVFLIGADSQLVNIALNKTTNMSRVSDSHGPHLAVDGNSSDVSCSKSVVRDGTDTWWWVDLTQDVVVRQISLYVRQGSGMLNDSEVFVSPVSDIPPKNLEPCYNGNGTDVRDVINITCDSRGRYVIILKPGNQDNSTEGRLELCEVQVLVCLEGSYGPNCSNTCGQCSRPGCHPVSGVCQGGCKDGYKGDKCKTDCEPGMYGHWCSLTCGQCGFGTCDHVNGTCLGGCMGGYTGMTCNKAFHKEDGTISPLVAGVIGAVVMLITLILIVVVSALVLWFRASRSLMHVTSSTPGRYSRSKSDSLPLSQDTAPGTETNTRTQDSLRYVSTQAGSRQGTLRRPSIVSTKNSSNATSHDTVSDDPSYVNHGFSSQDQTEESTSSSQPMDMPMGMETEGSQAVTCPGQSNGLASSSSSSSSQPVYMQMGMVTKGSQSVTSPGQSNGLASSHSSSSSQPLYMPMGMGTEGSQAVTSQGQSNGLASSYSSSSSQPVYMPMDMGSNDNKVVTSQGQSDGLASSYSSSSSQPVYMPMDMGSNDNKVVTSQGQSDGLASSYSSQPVYTMDIESQPVYEPMECDDSGSIRPSAKQDLNKSLRLRDAQHDQKETST